jgi:hypothetical protein
MHVAWVEISLVNLWTTARSTKLSVVILFELIIHFVLLLIIIQHTSSQSLQIHPPKFYRCRPSQSACTRAQSPSHPIRPQLHFPS